MTGDAPGSPSGTCAREGTLPGRGTWGGRRRQTQGTQRGQGTALIVYKSCSANVMLSLTPQCTNSSQREDHRIEKLLFKSLYYNKRIRLFNLLASSLPDPRLPVFIYFICFQFSCFLSSSFPSFQKTSQGTPPRTGI